MTIEWAILVTAFSTGILGSLHCVGMCGPLVASLPFLSFKGSKMLGAMFLYHTGRIFMYALIGMAFGALGSGFHLFGWQQALSVVAGLVVLMIYFSDKIFSASVRQKFSFDKPYLKISQIFNNNKQSSSFFIAGLLNGMLPCGLVYVAAGTAFATGSLLQGAVAMLLFGIGTIPLLTIAVLMSKLVSIGIRGKFRKIMPYLVVLVACLLILRGLGLNIPYLSPIAASKSVPVSCHSN